MQDCKQCKSTFEITSEDRIFYDKLHISEPTLCPICRLQRLLTYRNENRYYSRKCDFCKKPMVSVHSPDKPYPVYCHACWWGDKWDPLTYGQDFDFSRPFFEQFVELRAKVPQLAMMNDNGVGSENCEYCQDLSRGKNCYLVTGAWYIRDSYYSNNCNAEVRDMVDCASVNIASELVYESIDSQQLYHCAFLENSNNCSDSFLGYDLKGCKNCFGCVGLRQKQFHIFNEPYSEADYRAKISEFETGSYKTLETLKKKFDAFLKKFPRKDMNLVECENCSGNHLYQCRNFMGFDSFRGENCKYVYKADGSRNSHDVFQTGKGEWCCECVTADESYMIAFTTWCWRDKFTYYSDNCHSSENLLGCISLRRSKNCLMNRQYTPEEFNALLPRVITHMKKTGEWGEFFPVSHSPFGYNETLAGEYFPLTKEEVTKRGWKWQDDSPFTTGKETLSLGQIPDHIRDVKDNIADQTLACVVCSKNYKIIPEELNFYRKMDLPVPHTCPTCRREKRMKRKTPYQLWARTCAKCGKPIETAYSPDRPEKVYCEQCYLKEVY